MSSWNVSSRSLQESTTALPAGILHAWHAHRSSILVALVILLSLLRLYAHWKARLSGISNGPHKQIDGSVDTQGLAPAHTKSLASIANKEVKLFQDFAPRRIVGKKLGRPTRELSAFDAQREQIQLLIFFFSLGGSTEAIAKSESLKITSWLTESHAESTILPPQVLDLSYVEFEDYFLAPPKAASNTRFFYLLLIPTYNIDSSMNTFLQELEETHHDFRIDTAPLINLLGYSVFGFGDKEGWPSEEEGYCSQAKELDKWMAKLTSRKRAFPLGMGDVKCDWESRLREWRSGVQDVLLEIKAGGGLGQGLTGSGNAEESDVEDEADFAPKSTKRKILKTSAALVDVEDLGISYRKEDAQPLTIDFTTTGSVAKRSSLVTKEMVPKDSPTFKSLTKQGYTIVGSHSGVKICRWTKSALRGRGSCYKYSFYGIKSHLCMETTPSLSCSNKCVFCWRHGTNPVGTTWRWKVDPPELIFNGVKEGHYKKIKMLKGVPGVRAERFAEAMQIRHCALSLVGEPIFYPHINEFLAMLHKERISSFLVCNAQHPEQLAALDHVTQLYVSIDASNKASLKKIDRPLHRDFWERFLTCLDILRERRFEQRTVFRLTLVKGFNIDDEAEGYADLVARGLPCFIEVKGVTFCGTSTSAGAGLTMQNVPFYEEVCQFVKALEGALEKRGLAYGIAAEHAHSCCVLLGSSRFQIHGVWYTTIGYDKFFDCLESGKPFGPEDYIGEPTPEWALWGNGGFDPRDERFFRKNRKEVSYQPDSRAVVLA